MASFCIDGKHVAVEPSNDYFAMAKEVQAKSGCGWSTACAHVRRKFPESRDYFIKSGGCGRSQA